MKDIFTRDSGYTPRSTFLDSAKRKEKEVCPRCGKPLIIQTASEMNEDIICETCAVAETHHPAYILAAEKRIAEMHNGNFDFKGHFVGQKYPFGYAFCSVDGCNITMKEIICVVDNGKKRFFLCPNHLLMCVLDLVDEADINYYKPNHSGKGTCEACGEEGFTIVFSDGPTPKIELCEEHFKAIVKRALKPDEYFRLHEKYGDIFLLHDDFYDPDSGIAVQPAE